MSVITIPHSITERLGDVASEDFAAPINDIDIGARKDAVAIAEERFERRLVEESGKLRVEIVKLNYRITLEIGIFNERITAESGKLHIEIEKLRTAVEKSSKENVKWMFLFWIGQLAAMAALLKFFVK